MSCLCGNGQIDPGELCDGNCPTSCPANSCTTATLVGSAAICDARCVNTSITACTNNDGCCPAGCTGLNDTDCAVCGNGRVEAGEQCDGGLCCTNTCRFAGTGQVCQQNVVTRYICANGTSCGQDVFVQRQHKYCSGSSAICTGGLQWDTPTVHDNCTTAETCTPGDSSCNANSTCAGTCQCSTGVCCDGCNYRPASVICQTNAQLEYGCPWGTSCGSNLGIRYRDRFCSGSSSACAGTNYGSWKSWQFSSVCSSIQACAASGSSASCTSPAICQPAPPPSPPDLEITRLAVSPTTIGVNTRFQIYYTAHNSGGQAAGAHELDIRLATTATFDPNAPLIRTVPIASMSPNGFVSDTLYNLSLPAGVTGGTRYVVARVDTQNQVQEGSESNNDASAEVTLTLPTAPTAAIVCAGTRCSSQPSPLPHSISIQTGWSPCRGNLPYTWVATGEFQRGMDRMCLGGPATAGPRGNCNNAIAELTGPGPWTGRANLGMNLYIATDGSVASTGLTSLVATCDQPGVVDVAVTSVTGPASAELSSRIAVTYTVRNLGATAIGEHSNWLYLSPTTRADASSAVDLCSEAVPSLPVGASYTRTLSNCLVPTNKPPGAYYLIVKHANGQAESNTANNEYATPITLTMPRVAINCTGLSCSSSPTPLPINGTAATGWDPCLGGAFTWQARGVFDGRGRACIGGLATAGFTGGCAGGVELIGGNQTWTGSSLGPTIVSLATGSSGNSALLSLVATCLPRPDRDLTLISLSGPAAVSTRSRIRVSYTEQNLRALAAGSHTVEVRLSRDQTFDRTDTLLCTETVPGLAGHASRSATLTNCPVPSSLASGLWYLVARTDAGATVQEFLENNNDRASAQITVSPGLSWDSDGDGFPDRVDAYPCDPLASAQAFVPAQGTHAMVQFEDTWPEPFDLDFNDVVIAYNYIYRLTASGQAVGLRATYNLQALGGIYDNGLGLHLPVPRALVASVTRQIGANATSTALTLSPNDPEATFTISDNLREFFGNIPWQINSIPGTPVRTGQTIELLVTFTQPVALPATLAPYDLYIFRTADQSHEIHRLEYAGTANMNQSLFRTGDDRSTPSRHFVNGQGLPFTLMLPALAPYPAEETPIHSLFTKIAAWAASGGVRDRDFYVSGVNPASAFTGPPAPSFPRGDNDAAKACIQPARVYVLGGLDQGGTDSNEVLVASTIANGGLGNWISTASFYLPRYSHAAVAYDGYVYVLGGIRPREPRIADVSVARIRPDGTLEPWRATSPLPEGRREFAAAAWNGYLYVLGGETANSLHGTNGIYVARINSDGTLGAWSGVPAVFAGPRYSHAAAVYNGYLYVLGGWSGRPTNHVQAARIRPDGMLDAWRTGLNSFSTPRFVHAAAANAGYLYIAGGAADGNATNLLRDVQAARINPDGSIGSWSATTPLPQGRYSHQLAASGQGLYVLGGHELVLARQIIFAPFQADGRLGTWTPTTVLPVARRLYTVAVQEP